jgi:hypothetical protein
MNAEDVISGTQEDGVSGSEHVTVCRVGIDPDDSRLTYSNCPSAQELPVEMEPRCELFPA